MADPISELVNDQPTPAVISTAVDDDPDYQPGEDNPPGSVQTSPVIGFFSGEKEDGATYQARFLIRVADKPSHLKAGASKLTTGEVDYNVLNVRTRRWEGVVNGYSLELGR